MQYAPVLDSEGVSQPVRHKRSHPVSTAACEAFRQVRDRHCGGQHEMLHRHHALPSHPLPGAWQATSPCPGSPLTRRLAQQCRRCLAARRLCSADYHLQHIAIGSYSVALQASAVYGPCTLTCQAMSWASWHLGIMIPFTLNQASRVKGSMLHVTRWRDHQAAKGGALTGSCQFNVLVGIVEGRPQ